MQNSMPVKCASCSLIYQPSSDLWMLEEYDEPFTPTKWFCNFQCLSVWTVRKALVNTGLFTGL